MTCEKQVAVFVRRGDTSSLQLINALGGAVAERIATDCAEAEAGCRAAGVPGLPAIRVGAEWLKAPVTRAELEARSGCR